MTIPTLFCPHNLAQMVLSLNLFTFATLLTTTFDLDLNHYSKCQLEMMNPEKKTVFNTSKTKECNN